MYLYIMRMSVIVCVFWSGFWVTYMFVEEKTTGKCVLTNKIIGIFTTIENWQH